MVSERIVVIGASAGGVEALQSLAAQLPADFPCPILVVVHIGKRPSILPSLLEKAGPLAASHARHGEPLKAGHFFVAPPDHHLMVVDGHVSLSHGPKEHHARPAVDPLFRSAALAFGAGTIAIVLTGWGEDGTAGLQAVKSCGGTTVAQDPEDARITGMPLAALRLGAADRCARLDELGPMIERLLATEAPPPRECPPLLRHEQELFMSRGDPLDHLHAIGQPSTYVCPECKGSLWEVRDAEPPRFRCHTGHAYTLRSLQRAQSEETDAAMWGAIRGLQEEALLLRRMAKQSFDEGDAREAARLEHSAEAVMRHAKRLKELAERAPDDVVEDAPRARTGSDG